jgi:integrase
MFKINYYLQTVKHERVYKFILISVVWDGLRVRTTLNIEIDPKLWNKDKQRIKSSATNPRKINDILDKLNVKLNEYYDTIKREKKRPPTQAEVKRAIKAILKDKEIKEPIIKQKKQRTFMENFDEFIKDSESGDRLSNGKKVQLNTIKTYITTKNHLEGYVSTTKNELTFEGMDNNFFASFTKYLSNKKKLSNNSQGKAIKVIKTFMHDAFQRGLHANLKFVKALIVKDEETTLVALNEDELASIENVKGLSPSNEKCRDMFLIQIYTGLRYSDLANLKKANFNYDENIITIHTIKTQDILTIPMSGKLKTILAKYPIKLPVIANQKYNSHLKEICREAGINTPVQLVHYINDKRIEEIKPKYDLISSHTARRTFITLSLKRGVIPEMLQHISGHKSRKSFQRYVRVTSEESVKAVAGVWE